MSQIIPLADKLHRATMEMPRRARCSPSEARRTVVSLPATSSVSLYRRHFRQLLEQTQRFVQSEYALVQDGEPLFASPAHTAAARAGLGAARSSTRKAGHASMLFPG